MKTTKATMRLIKTAEGYNFYVGIDENGITYYNITPVEQPMPNGGYYSSEFICGVKRVPNYFLDL